VAVEVMRCRRRSRDGEEDAMAAAVEVSLCGHTTTAGIHGSASGEGMRRAK